MELMEPLPENAAQVERHAADLKRAHPELSIESHVAYTVTGGGFRFLPAVGNATSDGA